MDIALVTGASKGMGLEWVKQLAEAGYSVVLTARSLEKAKDAAAPLQEQGLKVYPQQLDVTSAEESINLMQWIAETFGRLDVLINNAGVNSGTRARGDKALQRKNLLIEELDKRELLAMVDINAVSPILLAQQMRPLLKQSKHPRIINIGSWFGSISGTTRGGNYSYAVSKSALNMMNRIFAYDVREEGIISVVVNPGWVQTDMGGKRAQFTQTESVQNLRSNVLDRLQLEHTGQFFNYDGELYPW